MENTKYLERAIIERSAHQHIYIDDEKEKNLLIEKMLKDYGIELNNAKPIAIKLEDYLLPNLEISRELDSKVVKSLSREHLYLAIVYQILKNIKEELGNKEATNLSQNFINIINKIIVKDKSKQIKSINELLSALKKSLYYYLEAYTTYSKNGNINLNQKDLIIPYAKDLQFWLHFIKKSINTNAYFAMLVNNDKGMNKMTELTLNDIIAMHITSDLVVKLFLNSIDDFSDYDLNNHFVTTPQNYEIVDLERKARLARTK